MSKRRQRDSGKRRQQGQPREPRRRPVFAARPFEGLVDEPEWIALRELVPAATAPLRLKAELAAEHPGRQVILATLLPMAWPAMTRPDGRIYLGLQRQADSGDANRDLAASLLAALDTEPGGLVTVPPDPGPGPRLADLLDDGRLDITVHDGFAFWTDDEPTDPDVAASLERANQSVFPTVRLTAARAAYWCRMPERAHLRWVLPDLEDAALNALARLGAAGGLKLGEETRFAGMFRAHGRLVPVWDLPRETPAGEWEAPLADFAKRYEEALADEGPLDAAARRARQGLIGRQLTLR